MNALQNFDLSVFYWINGAIHTDFLDMVAPLWRNKFFWLPLYVFFFAFMWLNFEFKQATRFLLVLILVVGASDFISSSVIKVSVQRVRPCNQAELKSSVRSLVPCGSGYSFPSSHAANHFAAATFLSLTLAKRWRWLRPASLTWAACISFAQIYVGVHFPIDVLAGGLLGALCAFVGYFFYKKQFDKSWADKMT